MLNLREKCEAQGLVVDEAVLAKLNDYMTLFAAWAKVHNLTAIKKPQAQVDLLLMPSLSISKHTAKYDKVLDLGSGGGFPGLALAILQNKKKWVLVEKSPKKCAFLRHVIHQLKLDNTSLISENFSNIAIDSTVDAIVTRGSCKLKAQFALTKDWRAQGASLLSVQSVDSIKGFSIKPPMQLENLSFVQQDKCLKLLIVPAGVDLE